MARHKAQFGKEECSNGEKQEHYSQEHDLYHLTFDYIYFVPVIRFHPGLQQLPGFH